MLAGGAQRLAFVASCFRGALPKNDLTACSLGFLADILQDLRAGSRARAYGSTEMRRVSPVDPKTRQRTQILSRARALDNWFARVCNLVQCESVSRDS